MLERATPNFYLDKRPSSQMYFSLEPFLQKFETAPPHIKDAKFNVTKNNFSSIFFCKYMGLTVI